MFLLLVVLCIVVVRWSYRKHTYSIANGIYDEPSTAAVAVPNAIYMTMSTHYDYIKDDQVVLPHTHDGVKMESNPSYGTTTSSTNSDVIIQSNPSYGLNKSAKVKSEDQYGYVQPNEYKPPVHHHTEDDTVKMKDNPSCGVTSREDKTMSQGLDDEVKITPNPAYHSTTNSNQSKSDNDYLLCVY